MEEFRDPRASEREAANRIYLTDSSMRLERVSVPLVRPRIHVRLLIAIPVVIVLLLTIMGGLLYQFVEQYFGMGEGSVNSRLLEEFAADWLLVLIMFDIGGAIVGFILAYSLTSAIDKIVRISEKIASGDLSTKASIHRPDEVGLLGTSFNYMIDSLNEFINTRNRFVMDSFSGGLVTVDTKGTITTYNSAAEQMLEIPAQDVAGKSVTEVFNRPGLERLHSLFSEVLWKKEVFSGKHVSIERNGKALTLSVNSTPMADKSGNIFGMIVNFRDLAALQEFYEHMNRADRLATVGTFATGLAHEIRNPLGAIKGTAQLLGEDVRDNPRAHEYTQIIVKEVNRLDSLVREVQSFSQPSLQAPNFPGDLSQIVRDTVALARSDPKSKLTEFQIEEEYGSLPVSIFSPDKIRQALLNIVVNAFQATPENGKVRIITKYVPDDPLPLWVEITNSGSSIPSEMLPRIFEPFFTTKDAGTGLGLPIAYQIVSYHDGDIDVRSGADEVSFTIKLPLHKPGETAET